MPEFKSIINYTGDGETTRWNINFAGGYLDPSHVFVETDGALSEAVLDGPSVVVIEPAVEDGTKFAIRRMTPYVLPLVDFTDGAAISERNLDTTARQSLLVAAEAADRADYDAVSSISFPAGETAPNLPDAAGRAGRLLTFDGDGHPVAKSLVELGIATSESAVADLQAYVSQVAVAVATANQASSDVAAANATIANHTSNIAGLTTTASGHASRLSSLEANTSSLGSQMSTANGRLNAIDAKLAGQLVSIKDFGAVCNGSTPDNAAFVAAVNSGAKRIYVPNGATISLASPLTFMYYEGVKFVGDGVQSSIITVLGTSGTVCTFNNCQDCGFVDVGFRYQAVPTSGWVLIFTNCFEPVAKVRMDYHYNGIWVQSGSEPRLDVVARYAFGEVLGVAFGSDNTGGLYGGYLKYHGDNPPAVGLTNFSAYAPSKAFTVGQLTEANGNYYVCTQAGTTGLSSSPSGTSGPRFLTNLVDGTARWRFICQNEATHLLQGSYAYSIRIEKSFALNGAYSFRMTDYFNTGSSYPMWAYLGLESDHAFNTGIHLGAGEGVYLNDNCWVGSCMRGNGIVTVSTFRGELVVSDTARVLGNAQHGLLLNTGKAYKIGGLYSGTWAPHSPRRVSTIPYRRAASLSASGLAAIISAALRQRPSVTSRRSLRSMRAAPTRTPPSCVRSSRPALTA